MQYNIIFNTAPNTNKETRLFLKFKTDKLQPRYKECDLIDFPTKAIPKDWWLLLFQLENYHTCLNNIRAQYKEEARVYLVNHPALFIRNKKKQRIAVQNYIDEIGIILPAPLSIHTDYHQQQQALIECEWLESQPLPQHIKKPIWNTRDQLNLTELRILTEMRWRTDLRTQLTYLTCAELGRKMEVSPEILRRALASKALEPFVEVEKVQGCKTQTLQFTPHGRAVFLENVKTKTCEEGDLYTRDLIDERTTINTSVQKVFPLSDYHFHAHIALVKRLTDEYKKILNNHIAIPEIRKQASLALALMDAI